jgi:hypothetical protein
MQRALRAATAVRSWAVTTAFLAPSRSVRPAGRPGCLFSAMATPDTLPSASVIINGKHVPVTGSHACIKLDDVLAAAPFKDWVAAMDPELLVHSVSVTDVDYFGSRVGFIKMRADVEFHGQRVPGIVFLRGGAVAILVVLRCEGERWVVCCRQPRVPVGRAGFLEIPAGMLDGSGHFAGVAAKVRSCAPSGLCRPPVTLA